MKMPNSSVEAAHTSPANKKYDLKEDTVMSLAFISIFINAQGRRTRLRPKKSVCFYKKRHKKMTTICSDIVLAKICSTKIICLAVPFIQTFMTLNSWQTSASWLQ